MIYVIIYLAIGIFNGILGLWVYSRYLKEKSGKFDIWYIVGILVVVIAWPITNILAFVVRYKNGWKA